MTTMSKYSMNYRPIYNHTILLMVIVLLYLLFLRQRLGPSVHPLPFLGLHPWEGVRPSEGRSPSEAEDIFLYQRLISLKQLSYKFWKFRLHGERIMVKGSEELSNEADIFLFQIIIS